MDKKLMLSEFDLSNEIIKRLDWSSYDTEDRDERIVDDVVAAVLAFQASGGVVVADHSEERTDQRFYQCDEDDEDFVPDEIDQDELDDLFAPSVLDELDPWDIWR